MAILKFFGNRVLRGGKSSFNPNLLKVGLFIIYLSFAENLLNPYGTSYHFSFLFRDLSYSKDLDDRNMMVLDESHISVASSFVLYLSN